MAQSVNPSLVTQDLTFCADSASEPRRPSSVKDAADQIAALNSKDYTTYSSGGKTHYVWTFLSTETFNTSRWSLLVDAFVVGGGGAGKALGYVAHNGGGGAGGVAYATGFLLPAGTSTFTVGAGGGEGGKGVDSSILTNQYGGNTLVGNGGGCTGKNSADTNSNGGSGGGSYVYSNGGDENQSSENSVLTSGFVTNFGNDGGNHTGTSGGQYGAAGGGGAGAAGHDGTSVSVGDNGDGGVGIQEGVDFYINGTSNWYAGGGGGTCVTCAVGGTGGGGNGGNWGACNGQSGTANTGGGGGGHDYRGSGTQNFSGGSGIIIIRLTDDPGSISESVLYDLASGDSGQMYCGTCVDFDGTDASVNYGDVTWLDGLTVVSMSCWFYLDGAPPNAAAMLVSKDNTLECAVRRDSTTEYSLSINNDHVKFTSATAVATGEWIHVVYTWNSIGDVRKLYVNGALEETNTSGNESGLALLGSSAILSIGDRPSHSYEIDGKMADVKLFSKELSASNVKELYENSKVIIPTKQDSSGEFLSQGDLLLWAPLTEGGGSIAYDGSGYSHNGTYTGTSFLTGQSGCPQLITGYNKPLLSDGATDLYVNFGNPSSVLDIGTGDFTLGYWINPKTITGSYVGHVTYTASAGASRFETAFLSSTIHVYTTNGSWNNTGYAPPLNAWTHILFKRESNSITMHVNGSSSSTWTLASSITLGPCTGLKILKHDSGTTYASLDGLLNEVVFYTSALSNSHIKALASRVTLGGSLNSAALLNNAVYPMDWVSGASVTGITAESNASSSLDACNTTDSLVFVEGQRYQASFRADLISGSGPTFSIVDAVNWSVSKTGMSAINVVSGQNSREWVSTDSGTFVAVWYKQSAASVFNISDFSIVPVGIPLPPNAMSMGSDVAEEVSAKSSNAVESTYSYGGITYKVWTYRTSGTFVVPREIEVDVVIVGGGGGGGYNVGGGGGAGGLVSETLTTVQSAAGGTSYRVVVGEGGEGMWSGRTYGLPNTSGGDSFVTIDSATTAVGGGRGGNYVAGSFTPEGCETGGSGGAGRHGAGGCAGTAGQGNAGGSGTSGGGRYAGGGGGGAGATGANASLTPLITAGDGGNGKNDFINSSVAETAALLAAVLPTVGGGYLAGGGGGSKQGGGVSTVGAGGLGGGGKGASYYSHDGENGQVNTGGGGGAEMDGGSGVVIIRYAVPTPAGYWRNDSDITWTDLSGNRNNGTVTNSNGAILLKQGYSGSGSTNTGRDNQGFLLKQKDVGAVGFANYIANTSTTGVPIGDMIVTSGGFNVGTSGGAGTFAASAWINIENNASIKTVLNKRTQNGSWPCIDMAVGTTGQVICNYSTTSYGQCLETYTTDGGVIDTGEWYNIVFVKPAGDYQGVKIYVNGSEVSWTNTLYGSHSYSTTVATSTQPMYLGRFLDGNNSTGNWVNPWVGQLGPIQVYTEALTSAQVKQNFAAQANRFQVPRGIVGSGLRMWLDAAQPGSYPGSGTTWYDLSGNDNNVTLDNGTTFSTAKGGVIVFNGAKDGTLDVSSWIKDVSYVTMSGWWYHNGDAYGAPFSILTDTSPVSSADGFWWHDSFGGGATLYLRTEDASAGEKGVVVPAGVYVSAGNWYHVALVVGKSTFDLYYNGALYYSWATGGFDWANLNSDAAILHLVLQHGSYANGSMGNVQLYDRALSASQVAQNFRAGSERFGVTMGA